MFWERFDLLCKSRGESPSKIAIDIGLARNSVIHWREGRMPRNSTLEKISKYFQVSVPYLVGWTDDPNDETATNPKKEAFSLSDSIKIITRNQDIMKMVEVLYLIKKKGKLNLADRFLREMIQ